MSVGDVFRLNIVTANNPNVAVAVNGLHFQQVGSLFFDTPEEDLMESWRFNAEALYGNLITSFMFIIKYTVAQAPDFQTSLESDFAPIACTRSGEPLPPRTAGLAQIHTATFSKRGRGRMFLPPANEAGSGGSAPTTGYRTDFDAFRDAVMDTMAVETTGFAGWQFGMWSPADQVFRVATSLRLVTTWSSKRSRRNLY